MKTKNVVLVLSIAAVWLLTAGSTLALSPAPDTSPPAEQLTTNLPAVQLNEVQARPAPGQHQWVELYRSGTQQHLLYLPLVLKGSGQVGSSAEAAPSPRPAAEPNPDISGWQVSNQSGGNYTIPDALPPVPPGCFVLIRFDGLGPDDYNFGDGVAVLHAPADIFVQAADQVALYTGATHNPQTIRDFVAYGAAPGDQANDAIAAGLWEADWWVDFNVGAGAQDASAPPPANRTIGLYPGHANLSPDDWAVYGAADHTPGGANPVPQAIWSTAADGAAMASDGFALGWMLVPGATYQLQIDDDEKFGSPLVDVTLTQPYYTPASPLPGGVYWWRVRASLGQWQAAWSTPIRVTVVPVAGFQAAGDAAEALSLGPDAELSMTWLRQRKDNPLLCLDGDNEGDSTTSGVEEAWDADTPGRHLHARPE